MMSDAARLSQNDPALLPEAMEAVESGLPREVADERRTEIRAG
jgi:hypothetical protein